jgi:hypothetical protein
LLWSLWRCSSVGRAGVEKPRVGGSSPSVSTMKIKRRTFGDNPRIESDVQNNEELLAIEWIKKTWIDAGYTIAYSPKDSQYSNYSTLMVVKNKSYFVIGYIDGDGSELGLSNYLDLLS